MCEEYKDLGVRCLATGRVMRRKGGARGVVPGAQALAQAGRKAMHALLSTCRKHHLVQPFIKLRLFDALVEPVMSYACQVWGPWVFHGMLEKPWNTGSEEVHLDFLRIMAGVGRQVKRELLLWEFMRYPIMWHWVRLVARFWQKIRASDAAYSILSKAWQGDIMLMLQGCRDCWVYKVLDTMSTLGVVDRNLWHCQGNQPRTMHDVMAIQLDEEEVHVALQAKWKAGMAHYVALHLDPRSPECTSGDIMAATYVAWVRKGADVFGCSPVCFKHMGLSFKQLQCILRFRLGWHRLGVQTGRHAGVPRHERVCVMCQALGDEMEDGQNFASRGPEAFSG